MHSFDQSTSETVQVGTAQPADDVFVMPASVAQERYWLLDQMDPGNTSLNVPLALDLKGELDVAALRRTLDAIVARHEILRTTFLKRDGKVVQVIAPEEKAAFEIVDLGSVPNNSAEADRLKVEEAHLVFDLANGPLFIPKLLKLGPADHILMLTLHHIVCDGWSNGVLVNEIGQIYAAFSKGEPSPLEELPIQYGDFAAWQHEWLEGEDFEEQLAYWKDQLGNELPKLNLPTDYPRSKNRTSYGAIESLLLPQPLSRAIKALAQREDVTPYMVVLAAFNVLLHRLTGQDQILVGSPTANRMSTETEGLVGPFANTLLLKSDLSGDPTFGALLQRVKDVSLGAFSNQTLPFEKLVENVKLASAQKGSQLFQVLFVLQTAFMQPTEANGVKITPIRSVSPGSIFELLMGVVERAEGARLQMEYNTELFKPETIGQMLDDLHAILRFGVLDKDRRLSELVFERSETKLSTPEVTKAKRETILEVVSTTKGNRDLSQGEFVGRNGNGVGSQVANRVAEDPVVTLKPAVNGNGKAESSPRSVRVSAPAAEKDRIEESLKEIWQEMLHVNSISIDDDFFEIGGHSLLGAQIFAEIGKRLGANLPLASLLTATTIRQLTPLVRQALQPVPTVQGKDEIEETLKQIWREMLNLSSVSIDDDFFELGGHSLLGAQIFSEIEKRLGVNLPLSALLTATTIRQLADMVREWRPKDVWTSLVPLNPKGNKPPIFLMHAAGGNVLFYKDLTERLGPDQPVYGMQAVGLSGHQSAYDRIEDMAKHYIKEIRGVQQSGPYCVGGSSVGGLIAYEVAQQLKKSGEKVALLVLFDTGAPGYGAVIRKHSRVVEALLNQAERIQQHVEALRMAESGKRWKYVVEKATKVKNQIRRTYKQKTRQIARGILTGLGRPLPETLVVTQNAIAAASRAYKPVEYNGDILLFRATKQQRGVKEDATLGWSKFAAGKLDIHVVKGGHGTIVVEPRVRFVVEALKDRLAERGQKIVGRETRQLSS